MSVAPARVAWGRELLRAAIIIAAAGTLGLTLNAFKDKPLAVFDANGPGAIPDEPRVTPAQLKEWLNSKKTVLLLDVRNDDNYNLGHAPQSIRAPEPQFDESYHAQNLETILRAADNVVVLCDSSECPAADRIAKSLREMGHKNVSVLQDGWRGYLQQTDLPVEPPGQGGVRR